ncbi:MAG: LD-carboxypeptidase [Betaproteobacteria bacterium]|nr:LD-carboxypeptidase [Betaproteobacteria bacterium]
MKSDRFAVPRRLQPGATIGLFAPSGVINIPRHEQAVTRLESLGYRVVVAPEASNQWRYFAGTDDERLASFHRFLADPAIDALMMIRGGYGWSRLLHRVDWNLVAAVGKPLIGFSDFTALNLGALAKSNLITFAGPGAAIDFGGADDSAEVQADHAFMEAHCWPALRGEPVLAGPYPCEHEYSPQTLQGPLWGSNLSLMAALNGTPYMPSIEGGILFIEEVTEQPYAIERMLLQLFHAGILQKQRAIVLADFSDCEPEAGRFPYSLEHVTETLRTMLTIPVLTGLPFGHVAKKLTLPFGADATLDIAPGQFTLSY